MTQKNKNFFEIFLQGIGLYFTNIGSFLQYMFFPVFGQLFGAVVINYSIILYNQLLPSILTNFACLDTVLYKRLLLTLFITPGVTLFLTALWKYWIAYASITSMTENVLKSDRVYDFKAHNSLVTRRFFSYLSICLMYFSVVILTTIPIFWIIGIVILLYFTFVFPIFIFEEKLSPIQCFKKSTIYVQQNFGTVSGLLVLLGTFTYCIIPQIIYTGLKLIKVKGFLTAFVAEGIQTSSLYNINLILSGMNHNPVNPEIVSNIIITAIIYIVVIQLLLPLRSICVYLWYKTHCHDNDVVRKVDEKFLKRAKATGKKYKKG